MKIDVLLFMGIVLFIAIRCGWEEFQIFRNNLLIKENKNKTQVK